VRFSLSALVLAPSLLIGPKGAATDSEREPAVTSSLVRHALLSGAWRSSAYFFELLAIQRTENVAKVALFASLAVVLVPFIVLVFPSLKPDVSKTSHSWLAAVIALIGAMITNVNNGKFRVGVSDIYSVLQVVGFSMSVGCTATLDSVFLYWHLSRALS
jgi:hypothetical protein